MDIRKSQKIEPSEEKNLSARDNRRTYSPWQIAGMVAIVVAFIIVVALLIEPLCNAVQSNALINGTM